MAVDPSRVQPVVIVLPGQGGPNLVGDPGVTLPLGSSTYTQMIDYAGTANPVYVGLAPPGSATSAAVWQIKKLTYSGSNPTATQWAAGGAFTQVWDNRASLTYA